MREPRFVRRRVSGDTPTVNWVGVKEVMVRHVPGLGDVLAEGRSLFVWDGKGRGWDESQDSERERVMDRVAYR